MADPVYIAVLEWFQARKEFSGQEIPILKDSDKKTISLIRPELFDKLAQKEIELSRIALELEKDYD